MDNGVTNMSVVQGAEGETLLVSIPNSAISKISCQAATHGERDVVLSINLSRLPATLAALSGRSTDRCRFLDFRLIHPASCTFSCSLVCS